MPPSRWLPSVVAVASTQFALFVAPVLLLLSYVIAPAPVDLHVTTFELVATGIAVFFLP